MYDHLEVFVSGIYGSQTSFPGEWMTVDQARKDLEELRSMPECYSVPEDITPELYAYLWNQEREKDAYPHQMRFNEDELLLIRRALEIFGAGLEGWLADGKASPFTTAAVDELLRRVNDEVKGR